MQGMKPQSPTDQSSNDRRIARRRFVALATPVVMIALLLSTSVASQATALATAVLRGADIVSDGPSLADHHVAHRRRPASLARHHAVTHPQASFPAEQTPPQVPVGAAPAPTAVAKATPSTPANSETPAEEPAPPEEEEILSPPVEPTPPVVEPTPPPKSEPEPPPKGEPEPPPKSEPEPPPKSEPEPPPKSEPEPPPKSEPEPPKVEPNEPVEETPPPAAAPFFDGSAIDDFALTQAAPGAITEVPDPLGSGETVLKMTVDNGDVAPITPTENPRAQAISPDLIKNGDEFWLHTKFLLPADFPTASGGWMALMEIYGEPFHNSSPWQIDIEGNELSWVRNSTYRFDVPWEEPIRKGVWVDVLLHERFADDGWVEMWIDGRKLTFFGGGTYNPGNFGASDRLVMQTMDSSNNGGPNAAKIMNYRKVDMFETATVYFGALRLGGTRASVGS
jgi:hypothetical protein